MKAVVAAFNQEKALVGAFSVIVQQVVEPMEHYTALNTTLAPAVVTVSVVTHTPTCPHTASLAPDLSLQYVSHFVTVLSRSRDAREGRRAVCWQLERDSHTLCHVIIAPPSPPHHRLTLPT